MGVGTDSSFERGDANGDGIVDAADYVIWRHTMGPATSLGVFAGSRISVNVVPEPTTIGLALAGAILLAMRAGGRCRQHDYRRNKRYGRKRSACCADELNRSPVGQ